MVSTTSQLQVASNFMIRNYDTVELVPVGGHSTERCLESHQVEKLSSPNFLLPFIYVFLAQISRVLMSAADRAIVS